MAGDLGHRIWRAARRNAFVLRMALALIVSVVLLLAGSQLYFSRAVTRELLHQDARSYAIDARAVEVAYIEGDDHQDGVEDALELVDSMEDRHGIMSARLLASDGSSISGVHDPDIASLAEGVPHAAGTEPLAVTPSETGSRLDFHAPVELGGRSFVLEVNASRSVLNERMAAMRDEALVFSTLALLLALVLFYLVGGRHLARRHRDVVEAATRDPLTDLGNHRSFQEELERAVAFAARRDEALAVALVDLDDFKLINDRQGHRQGDEVLMHVARVLEQGRPEDRAFRIGGDEFALLLPGADGVGVRTAIHRRLSAARQDRKACDFTCGVAVLPAGTTAEAAMLWEQADSALYEGKRRGGGGVVVFDDVAKLHSVVTPTKIHALRRLLENPRLEIAFQPIWDLEQDRVLGVEALARPWPGYGFDGPADMFAVAEKAGRAHELDSVCRYAALQHAADLPDDVLLFLNVNPQSLAHDTLTGDRLVRAVTAAGLEPERVVLEITERSQARPDQIVADAIRLRSLGFRLALDDVGAGNSGLEMLRDLPVDFVKIDRSVISRAIRDKHAEAVLLAIVAYAGRADAFVIAEGIESEEVLQFVRNAGSLQIVRDLPIRGGQGYLLGRPVNGLAQQPRGRGSRRAVSEPGSPRR
jgi:diguanylate cyclase (GGDEF)-like protein